MRQQQLAHPSIPLHGKRLVAQIETNPCPTAYSLKPVTGNGDIEVEHGLERAQSRRIRWIRAVGTAGALAESRIRQCLRRRRHIPGDLRSQKLLRSLREGRDEVTVDPAIAARARAAVEAMVAIGTPSPVGE